MITLEQLEQAVSSQYQTIVLEISALDSSTLNYKPAPES